MTTVLAPEDVDHVDPAAEAADPDAPYGRNPEGVPYKRPKEWRDKLAAKLAEGRRTQSAAAPPRKPAKKTAAKGSSSAAPDYYAGAMALAQLPAVVLTVASKFKPTLALDAAALTLHAPNLAAAAAATAERDERFAALLDKALSIVPYGALLGAALGLGMQIAANHGAIPVVAEMGILSPDELIAVATGQPTAA